MSTCGTDLAAIIGGTMGADGASQTFLYRARDPWPLLVHTLMAQGSLPLGGKGINFMALLPVPHMITLYPKTRPNSSIGSHIMRLHSKTRSHTSIASYITRLHSKTWPRISFASHIIRVHSKTWSHTSIASYIIRLHSKTWPHTSV